MNIFVFGGTGYLGSAAVRALLEDGHIVQVLVRPSSSEAKATEMGAEAVRGDLAEPSSYETALSTADGVIFAASGQGENWEKADRVATEAVTAQLGGTDKPLVRVLGSMVYGDTGTKPKSEDAPLNPPPFLKSAAQTEDDLLGNEDVRTAFVHAPFVYGRGGGDIPNLLIGAARDRGAALYIGDGANAWDTVHVDDVGRLIARAVRTPESRGRYVAAGSPLTTKEIAETIAAQLNLGGTKSLSADEAKEVFDFFATPLTLNQRFDGSRAAALGWTRQASSFADALSEY